MTATAAKYTEHLTADGKPSTTGDSQETVENGENKAQSMSVDCGATSNYSPHRESLAAAIEEEKTLLKLALPIIMSNFLNFIMNIVDFAMVGQLGREQLAAASLATAYYNTMFYPLSGVAMALDTLLSQSFGAQQYVIYGQWLISGCAVMALMTLPVIGMLLLSEVILVGVGLDPDLASRAAQFVHFLIPGVLPNVFFMLFTRYLQVNVSLWPALGCVTCSLHISILPVPLHAYTHG
jgi:MATE family multidrug resistance protein